jgi:putative ABC transport system permease protein
MDLTAIALRHLGRRKVRAFFLLTGLLIGVATVVGLVAITQALSGQAEAKLQGDGPNILITPATESMALSYGGIAVGGLTVGAGSLREADLARIDGIADRDSITAVAAELVAPVEVEGVRLLLMGVRPREQFALKRWWSVDRGRPLADEGELVAGARAAEALGLHMGDYLEVEGRRFMATGILAETGSQDDDLLIIDLATAQRMLDKPGELTLIEIGARYHEVPVSRVVEQLAEALPEAKVAEVQQTVQNRGYALEEFRSFSYALAAVVVAIEALVVFVTMMGSVRERTGEIGLFRALGFQRGHITRLVLIEAAAISLFAGLLGYVAGMGAVHAVLPLVAEGVQVLWTPLLAVASVGLSVAIGALASLYPALAAGKLDPTEALRSL